MSCGGYRTWPDARKDGARHHVPIVPLCTKCGIVGRSCPKWSHLSASDSAHRAAWSYLSRYGRPWDSSLVIRSSFVFRTASLWLRAESPWFGVFRNGSLHRAGASSMNSLPRGAGRRYRRRTTDRRARCLRGSGLGAGRTGSWDGRRSSSRRGDVHRQLGRGGCEGPRRDGERKRGRGCGPALRTLCSRTSSRGVLGRAGRHGGRTPEGYPRTRSFARRSRVPCLGNRQERDRVYGRSSLAAGAPRRGCRSDPLTGRSWSLRRGTGRLSRSAAAAPPPSAA